MDWVAAGDAGWMDAGEGSAGDAEGDVPRLVGEEGQEWQLRWCTGSAREEVLRRIRAAKGGAANAEAVRTGWSALERRYRREATRSREVILELLVDRLQDYDARVVRAVHVDVRAAAARMLEDRKAKRMVVPRGLAAEWLPERR